LGDKVGAPQKSNRVHLPPDITVGAALSPILESGLSHLLANEPSVVEARDVEGLHQLRVALRRLRAVFATYDALLDEKLMTQIEHEIKWISAICGAARDYDVFVENLIPAADEALAAAKPARAALERAAAAARADAWAKVVEAVASSRFTALVLVLAGLSRMERPPLADGIKRKDLAQPAPASLTTLGDEERHQLRKRLKRLRYTAEFFGSLYPQEAAKAYLKKLGALQDCFGALNDLATAGRLIGSLTAFGSAGKALNEAGQLVLEHHRKAADTLIGEAADRWAKLAKRKPFWRET
jgi:CHAD domain-containing protein